MDGLTATASDVPPEIEPSEADAWVARWRPAPAARLRLLCLPHTGGGTVAYYPWAQQLAPDIDVIAVRLPGREARFAHQPFTRLPDLVPALVDALEPWLDQPYAWFGHSLGALIAYEACRAVRQRGLVAPARLVVSGRRAPHLPDRDRPVHDAPTAALVARLRELNGTPSEVLADGAALASLLPVIRADFALAETYRHRPAAPLDCPITVFGGADDPLTTVAELRAWRHHSTAACAVRVFRGDHFFLHRTPEEVLPVLRAALLPPAPDGP